FSDLIPEVLYLGGRSGIRQDHLKEGTARLRISLDTVEIWQLLQVLLDLVSYLRLHIVGGRSPPADAHPPDLDGEAWILCTSEIEVGIDAGGAQENDHEQHQRLVRDRPFGEIKPFHGAPFPFAVGASSLVSARRRCGRAYRARASAPRGRRPCRRRRRRR